MTQIHEKSKKRVKDHGEVFTPSHIVEEMCDLIPAKAWKDSKYIFLEPSCGNGNFLVAIVARRLKSGVSIKSTLNTMWGMDIMADNIQEAHVRICQLIKSKLTKPLTVAQACELVAILQNNVYVVDDSIRVMKSGEFDKKKFLFEDPTGNNNVLGIIHGNKAVKKIKDSYKENELVQILLGGSVENV
jgi:hypothetical protein